VKDVVELVKQSGREFSDDQCPQLAAALAYYTVFALPPLVVLVLMVAGALVSPDEVRSALTGQVGAAIGPEGARTLMALIDQANQPGGGALRTVLSLVGVLLGATGAFLQLQFALNRAWEVKPAPHSGGVRTFVIKRLLSLGMVLVIAFLLMMSVALSTALSAAGGAVDAVIPGASGTVIGILGTVASLAIGTLLFAAIFNVLPDAHVAWRDVWPGAITTAVLFEIGKWAIGAYLGHSNPGKAYGAAGSLVVVLAWIYYTSMIVLFGAELTQTWANTRGSGVKPEKGSVLVEDEAEDCERDGRAA
jgi:membrane protein